MKQRLSALDVAVIAGELNRTLPSLYLANIYDLSSRIFLFKLSKPGGTKAQVLVDTGFRCHLTAFSRATAADPSAFVSRLRKHLRNRRVTRVRQIGTDRVLEIDFADGRYHLILEFFAEGNLILTDADYKVLALYRAVKAGSNQEELRNGAAYVLENRQNYATGVVTLEASQVREALQTISQQDLPDQHGGKKFKRRADHGLRKALAVVGLTYPAVLLEHLARQHKFDLATPIKGILEQEGQFESLMRLLEEAQRLSTELPAAESPSGYIIAKVKSQEAAPTATATEGSSVDDTNNDKENQNVVYDDFQPFLPSQYQDNPQYTIIHVDGFNRAVDKFYSSVESQLLASRLSDREAQAKRKLDNAKNEHAKRIGGLQQVQELNVRKAQAIEANLHWVQEASTAVNGLIAQEMDWTEIARLIEMEQQRNNPVAKIIHLPLKLHENTVTLKLAELELEDGVEDDEVDARSDDSASDSSDNGTTRQRTSHDLETLLIDIDLGLSAWANAGEYYDQRRSAAAKQEKTLQSSEKALKSTERKIQDDLKRGLKQEKPAMRQVRKQLWFEKFYYFISSEGHLVLGARDQQQSDVLYNKYLGKSDAYVHTDVAGAPTVIVKNKPEHSNDPLPLSTLVQAGAFCVASSAAWDSKALMGAWWVAADQLSKTAPTGDYLQPGNFHITGTKNQLPPAQLVLGFGIMFQISKESKARRLKHRVPAQEKIEASDRQTGDAESTNIAVKYAEHSPEVAEDLHQDGADANEPDADSDTHGDNNDAHSTKTHDSDLDKDVEQPEDADRDRPMVYNNPLQPEGSADQAANDAEVIDDDSQTEGSGDENQDSAGKTLNLANENPVSPDQVDSVTEGLAQVSTSSTPATERDSGTGKAKVTPHVRGKHGKKAKIKNKYADQDDKDRELALRLLGSAPSRDKTQAETEKTTDREAQVRQQQQRQREQQQKTQASGKAAERARQEHLKAGTSAMDPEETQELALVDDLVGTPRPGDELLECFVVCGPWEAMGSRLRWRVKLQPGSQKKGKAVHEILGSWTRSIDDRAKKRVPPVQDTQYQEEVTLRREGELIKNLRDVEIVGAMSVGKVRTILSAGAAGGAKGGDKGKAGRGAKGGTGKNARGGKGSKKTR